MNIRHDPVIHDLNKHNSELDENERYERLEKAVNERAKEIAAEMLTQEGHRDRGVVWGVGDVTEHIYSDIDESSRFDLILAAVLEGENTVENLKGFMLKHAEAVANDIAWREVE